MSFRLATGPNRQGKRIKILEPLSSKSPITSLKSEGYRWNPQPVSLSKIRCVCPDPIAANPLIKSPRHQCQLKNGHDVWSIASGWAALRCSVLNHTLGGFSMTRSRVSQDMSRPLLMLIIGVVLAIAPPTAANADRGTTRQARKTQAEAVTVAEAPPDSSSEVPASDVTQIAGPAESSLRDKPQPIAAQQQTAERANPEPPTTTVQPETALDPPHHSQTIGVDPNREPTVPKTERAPGASPETGLGAETEVGETSDLAAATQEEPSPDTVTEADTDTEVDTAPEAGTATEADVATEVEPSSDTAEVAPPSEDVARETQLIEADTLYLEGRVEEAEALYRQAKAPFTEDGSWQIPDPITEVEHLSPTGQVYWREAERGMARELEISSLVPLRLLVDKNPEFVPGYLRLADALVIYGQPEEALAVMESAASLYPSQPDLQKGLIERQVASHLWLEASITARQFAVLHPEHPDAPGLLQDSVEYQERFQAYLREQMTGNMISGVLGGALGVALTGNPFMALPTVQSSLLMLRGESSVGTAAAKSFKKRFDLIEDPDVQAYVDRIGHKLAKIGGRDFDYEFFIVNSEELNAFALPGGKVFINGGAIVKSNSEAELAGLIAHELAHAVLSHGFQAVTQSNATAGFTRLIPYVGGVATQLAVTDYSRDMEEQADLLGTRMLVSAGYAADGLRNFMATVEKENKETPFHWLSTHPRSRDRVSYLEALIERNGYSRYRYEGIAEHKQIKAQVQALMKEDSGKENLDQAIEDYKDKSAQKEEQSIPQKTDE